MTTLTGCRSLPRPETLLVSTTAVEKPMLAASAPRTRTTLHESSPHSPRNRRPSGKATASDSHRVSPTAMGQPSTAPPAGGTERDSGAFSDTFLGRYLSISLTTRPAFHRLAHQLTCHFAAILWVTLNGHSAKHACLSVV